MILKRDEVSALKLAFASYPTDLIWVANIFLAYYFAYVDAWK